MVPALKLLLPTVAGLVRNTKCFFQPLERMPGILAGGRPFLKIHAIHILIIVIFSYLLIWDTIPGIRSMPGRQLAAHSPVVPGYHNAVPGNNYRGIERQGSSIEI